MCTSKKDLYWTVAVAVIILISIVTYWLGGKGNEIVSYISFASALVSIVLALVAIFYSFFQNQNSQQNIGEMKNLVSEASRIMTEKAVELVGVTKEFLKSQTTKSSPITPSEDGAYPSVRFSFNATSDLTRLFAYFLFMSYKLKKPLPIEQYAVIAKPLVKMSAIELSSHVYGILFGLMCCLKDISLNQEQTSVQLLKIPNKFEEHLKGQIASLKKRNPRAAEYLVQIDNIT